MSKKNEYQGHLIREVYPDSIAEAMEIEPGDVLLRINNQKIEDVFDYRYMIKDEYVEVLIRKPEASREELCALLEAIPEPLRPRLSPILRIPTTRPNDRPATGNPHYSTSTQRRKGEARGPQRKDNGGAACRANSLSRCSCAPSAPLP